MAQGSGGFNIGPSAAYRGSHAVHHARAMLQMAAERRSSKVREASYTRPGLQIAQRDSRSALQTCQDLMFEARVTCTNDMHTMAYTAACICM